MPLRLSLMLLLGLTAAAGEVPPVAMRIEPFTVPPATGPVTHVLLRNLSDAPYEGSVSLALPDGWQIDPPERPASLAPHQTLRVPFSITKAVSSADNRYAATVRITGPRGTLTRRQEVVCASSPYFKPKIDGRGSEWDDAIPVSFVSGGKRAVLRSYWNRECFCLLVEVEEDELCGWRQGASSGHPLDAVQIALAPRVAAEAALPADQAKRYEFLLAAAASRWSGDRCFRLAGSEAAPEPACRRGELAPLLVKEVAIKVRRSGKITCYECAIPWSLMPAIRAMEGREIYFSFLIHDADGTGIRDWGSAAGLWPDQRRAGAWSSWAGVHWGDVPPFDHRIEWGLCSAKR